MPLLQRRTNQHDFLPMFRLMDDWASHVASKPDDCNSRFAKSSTTFRSFQPRFDIKETSAGYELQGEFPGIDQKDIDITFQDATTLAIRGRSEHFREEGQRPTAAIEGHETNNARPTNGEAKANHQPTVEDDTGEQQPQLTPATTTTDEAPSATPKHWLAERSVGEFARTFSFPDRVDQEAVKASLQNGILTIVVPKAAPPVSRKINIE